jgi:hypothetical protein
MQKQPWVPGSIFALISAFVLKEPPIEAEPSEDVRGPYPAGRLEDAGHKKTRTSFIRKQQ